MDKCATCGTPDGTKVRGTPVYLRPCVCFEFAFCGEPCLQAHEHSRVVDERHYAPPVEAVSDFGKGLKRRLLGNRYEVLLLDYVKIIRDAAGEFNKDGKISKTSKELLMRTFPEKFKDLVSKKNGDFVEQSVRGYSEAVVALMTENEIESEIAAEKLHNASEGLLDIWTKARLREKSKTAIKNAWRTFDQHLASFIVQVALSGDQGLKHADVSVAYTSLVTVARRVGLVLNGQNAAE